MSLAEPSTTYDLPLTKKGVMRLTPRLRERYLTPDVDGSDQVITQATGNEVRIWIWSDRENIRLEVQRDGFEVRRPYRQSIHRWGVSINRYLSDDTDDGPSVVVDDDGEKPTVEAQVQTFDAEVIPDV